MTRIRPITLDDAEVLYAVRNRNGVVGNLDPVQWRNWCLNFPFREEFEGVALGWILENEGVAVGSLSNIPMLYDFKGQTLRAAITQAWAVDPEHRSSSLKLMTASYRQPGVDLWIDDSASESVSKILTALKVDRIPSPDYDVPMLWPLRHRTFAAAALRRRAVPAADALACLLGTGMRIAGWARASGRSCPSAQVHPVGRFDNRFDALWEKIRTGPPRLRAVRTSAVLRWRFQKEFNNQSVTILVCEHSGELEGYAILLHHFRAHTGLKVCDVGDLQAVNDNPEVLRDLLLGALNVARDEGADALKLLSGKATKRSVALSLHPYTYHHPFWQLFYKVRDVGLATRLNFADVWDFSHFDTF